MALTDSLDISTQLVEQTFKEEGVQTSDAQRPEMAAATAGTTSTDQSNSSTDEIAKPAAETQATDVPNYKEQAVEHMKKILKDKTDLTDTQIEQEIYKRVLNAERRVQRETERAKTYETQVSEYGKYKSFYEELFKNPKIQALYNGKARIVEDSEESGEYADDPTQKELKEMRSMVSQLLTTVQGQQSLTNEQKRKEAEEAEARRVDTEISNEYKDLFNRYPKFKEWCTEKKKTGMSPLELEEIYDLAEHKGYTLTDAVDIYMARNGLPAVLANKEQEVIQRMRDKSRQTSESSSADVTTSKKMPSYRDSRALSEHLVGLAVGDS